MTLGRRLENYIGRATLSRPGFRRPCDGDLNLNVLQCAAWESEARHIAGREVIFKFEFVGDPFAERDGLAQVEAFRASWDGHYKVITFIIAYYRFAPRDLQNPMKAASGELKAGFPLVSQKAIQSCSKAYTSKPGATLRAFS